MRKNDIHAAIESGEQVRVQPTGTAGGWGVVTAGRDDYWLVTYIPQWENAYAEGAPVQYGAEREVWLRSLQIRETRSQHDERQAEIEAERVAEREAREAREAAKEAERAAKVAEVPAELIEDLERTAKQANDRAENYRVNIGVQAGNAGSPDDLADLVNDLAKASAERGVYLNTVDALTNHGVEAARQYLFDRLTRGTQDTFSGRRNDVRRAEFDGIRYAAENAAAEITFWVRTKAADPAPCNCGPCQTGREFEAQVAAEVEGSRTA